MQQQIRAATHEAARQARPWVIGFGRFGYVAKGVVYTLIGVLAVQAAVGGGGRITGKNGALQEIGGAPFGRYLLIAIAVGIVGYAAWRFIQAILDTEHKGSKAKGLAVRAGYFAIGIVHLGLAASAFHLLSGSGGSGGDQTRSWTVRLMSQQQGEWLVGIAGALVIGYGGRQLYRAWTSKFREKPRLRGMSATEDRWATRFGRIGYGARGVVFGLVGAFLIVAAIQSDPNEARGLDGALATLARQPWGSALLCAVAAGLTAYGLYMFVEARYRRMVIT